MGAEASDTEPSRNRAGGGERMGAETCGCVTNCATRRLPIQQRHVRFRGGFLSLAARRLSLSARCPALH
jgi:hypothetical protein